MKKQTALLLEVSTELDYSTEKEKAVSEILSASIYSDSLFSLLRMARNLDEVSDARDAVLFNDAVANACRLGSSLQNAIRKALSELEACFQESSGGEKLS